ncbi:MAG: UbiA family prenyltransferase [Zoogloeaceae bacterium]|jgi:4-hydroxybenzoate polyprenyltransferase|nr:UbiA family prenyltransferase [Zoogloeaceae bacterium]
MKRLLPYLKLMRFHFHASFITVLAGAWLFLPQGAAFPFLELLECYLCFNVLLYGGIYTFNDIIDCKADAVDPVKKQRPLPAGEISRMAALFFCLALVFSGFLLAGFILQREILFLFAAFLAANLLYTLVFKRIPYAGLALVALTHTLRMAFGIVIAGVVPALSFLTAFYVLLLCIAVTIHSRYNAKPRELQYYSPAIVNGLQIAFLLLFALLALFAWQSAPLHPAWFVLAAVLLLFLVAAHLAILRKPLARIFMIRRLPEQWPCAVPPTRIEKTENPDLSGNSHMRLLSKGELSIAVTQEDKMESEIILRHIPTGKKIFGVVLEAAVAWHGYYLLFVTEDCPFEEGLHIYFFNSDLVLLDSAALGWIYTPAIFEALRLIEPNRVQFRFVGGTDWQIELFSRPFFSLPALADPIAVSRDWKLFCYFKVHRDKSLP